MSDDITQKLRATMPDFKGLEISCPCRIRSLLMKDAADEIEKLTRERDEARAEVERLTEWQSINHSEQHKLGWSMTEFCEGKRDHLHEMWERPPSLDYGIAHIEAEIKRLRAHNARLRAQVDEYFREPDTHPVEREE